MLEKELCELFGVTEHMRRLVEEIDFIDLELKTETDLERIAYLKGRKDTLLELREIYADIHNIDKD